MPPGFFDHRARQIGYCVFLLVAGTSVHAEVPKVGPAHESNSVQKTGPIISPGHFLQKSLLGPWNRRFEVLDNTLIKLPRLPIVSRSYGPLRQITFLGGDRISGEIVGWNEDVLEFRLRGGKTVPLNRNAISKIHMPTGESEVFFEDFETEAAGTPSQGDEIKKAAFNRTMLDSNQSAHGQNSLRLNAKSGPFTLEIPDLPNVRVQFWFRVDPSVETHDLELNSVAHVDLELHSSERIKWRIDLATSRAQFSQTLGAGRRSVQQPIKIASGWHCLTVVLDKLRSMCIVDESLLFYETRQPGVLRSIGFSAAADFWIDTIVLSRLTNASNPIAAPQSNSDDVVTALDGNEWFGQVTGMNSTNVAIANERQERTLSSSRISGISFRQSEQPVREQTRLPIGRIAEIDFQPLVDRPKMPADRLTVSILEAKKDFLVLAHPWLGTFAVARAQIVRVQPLFWGQFQTLDARQIHLGDSIRQDFHRQIPDGIEWTGDIELPPWSDQTPAEIRLVLDVAELEPSGPDTPPGTPFLRQLRQGHLVTEMMVNDVAAGDLNRFLKFRSGPDQPERLRIPLDADRVRPGHNTFRLKQMPHGKSGRYDNCELSNLRLEIVFARPTE